MKRRAYIGLGANLGDPQATLHAAVEALKGLERSQFVALSPFYRTAPIDAEGPDYLNAVACLDSELEPFSLLLHLQDIERMLGRRRRGVPRNAARSIDLDLLLVGNLILRSTPLTLPHPRLHERAFVLRPLLDLAPQIVLPGLGPAADFLPRVANQRIEPLPGDGP
ncbi:MAG: 2-amino-4-hydroxy-6-hydroxymethyldihydropteridine diphosphokinase [Sutterellaceae bacterium]|nr:2-amino-4-hydroxy-6-hydroxymethyldihydropteridine diphosphokinase [Burkholderiaceae bacterium]MCX7901987.1 2-amino-4-hydroxy-6-hydroxymethyldihydropteridine diphosphokinase [Burkholderiaceae bacterium]MDW8429221.1 2-amino-4-hydroxy-6-hydroxymethyldihydropteridine diphosphokinase [Sutterellaceae bacterium]